MKKIVKHMRPKHTASTWMVFIVVLPAATMMHPTGASLLAIGMVLAAAFILRGLAHHEGYSDGYIEGRIERNDDE